MTVTDTIYNMPGSIEEAADSLGWFKSNPGLTDYMHKNPDKWFDWLKWNTSGDWSVLGNLAVNSIIIGIFLVLLLVFFRWCSKRLSSSFRDISLKWLFLIVWFYGFLVYDIGMCTGQYISLVTNAPMAILYAFKIFLFDSDVSEIQEVFHHNWVYSLNFALVHFFAAIISTLFLIKYFGYNILARGRMRIASCRCAKTVDETYVFWGFNDQANNLIESIQQHYKEENSTDYRIVIVRTNNENDDDRPEERTGLARIFDFLSMSTSEMEKLENLGCLCTGSYTNLNGTNANSNNEDIIGKALKLRSLKKLLQRHTGNKIHMLFLNDDEKENLHDVALLLNDSTIKSFTEENTSLNREVIFYCLARYNSIHRVIEDRYMSGSRRVKVIDSSHISVENLKLNEELLPVNFVKVEKDATVSSPFNSLVVGFSEVGQDSVRFLYEFGAFVKTGSTDTDVERSAFHMRVVDKRMADVAGAFIANAPAIDVSVPFIDGMEHPDALITLNQMDCQSIEFYHNLESWIKDLNYIVIATDDDELNITLAVRIFKMAARYRDNMDNLCILTRVHKDDDGHIKEIAEYYNRLWDAQNAVENYDGKMATQHVIKRDSKADMPIHLFGLDKRTYTYQNIIDDSMEEQAVDFKERYTASTRKDYKEPKCKEEYAWYKDIHDHILCIEGDPDNNPTLSAIMGIRRMQGQDYANCFHAATKKILAQEALEMSGLPKEFSWNLLTRKSETIEYMVKDGTIVAPQVFRILNVLAQTEHMRWNASHEILGYVSDGALPSRDEVKMSHSCITNWQNLTANIQSFDYDFIDLTLNIINPERPQKK